MSSVSKAISYELFLQAQTVLKDLGKTGKISRKLQAIIAAQIFEFQWLLRFLKLLVRA